MLLMYQDKENAPENGGMPAGGVVPPRAGVGGGRAFASLLPVLPPLHGGSSLRSALIDIKNGGMPPSPRGHRVNREA